MEEIINPTVTQFRAKNEIFTPSNLISIMRAMFVLPAVFCIYASQKDTHLYYLVAAIFIAAAMTDVLDGIIARKTDSVTEIGKIVDPLADKIFVGCVVIAMVYYHLLPVWFTAIILGRDLVIVAVGMWAKKKLGVVLPSNYIGKIAVVIISLTIFLIVIRAGVPGKTEVFSQVIIGLEWTSIALMAWSLVAYGVRLKHVLNG
ncbi:MAG TPA: CDP-alcohol phosphatidyltransferase family protein [Candidatus Kapabacteria bacterium]